VYRYFEDRDALVRAAIDRHLEMVWPLYLIHAIGEGPLAERIERIERIERFVTSRLRLYEAIAEAARAARIRSRTSLIMAEQVETTRKALRSQIEKQFAPELDRLTARRRRSVVAAADAMTQLEALDLYRVHRGFSAATTCTVLTDALGLLLGADAFLDGAQP